MIRHRDGHHGDGTDVWTGSSVLSIESAGGGAWGGVAGAFRHGGVGSEEALKGRVQIPKQEDRKSEAPPRTASRHVGV